MNLILLAPEDFVTDGRAIVRGRRHEHVLRVQRASEGDSLRAGVLGGGTGTARVVRIGADDLELDIHLDGMPPPKLPLDLILALPRPKVLRRVLQTVAAMGVPRLHLVNASRVEKSFWRSPCLGGEALRHELVLGLEQARDTVLPEVSLQPLFRPFVEDLLPGIAAASTALVAHPAAVDACPRDAAGPVTLAVGPEGGFVSYELELLAAGGFRAVTLGARVLRVEQAVPALLARLF